MRALAPRWRGVAVTLLDRQSIVSMETRARRGRAATRAAPTTFMPQIAGTDAGADIITANLFLHHFPPAPLARLLDLAARATRLFVACEPRRTQLALRSSRLLWAIGCNDVSLHDSIVSVRAGFNDQELSAPAGREAQVAMLGFPLILAAGPAFNDEVLSNPAVWRPVGIFPGGPRNSAARRLGAGLARMTGARHAHYRRLLIPPLRKGNVEALGDAMTRLAQEEIAAWPAGEAIDLWARVCRLMHTFAVGVLFSNNQERGYPVADMVSDLFRLKWSPSVRLRPVNLPVTPYGRLLKEGETLQHCILDWAGRGEKSGRPCAPKTALSRRRRSAGIF